MINIIGKVNMEKDKKLNFCCVKCRRKGAIINWQILDIISMNKIQQVGSAELNNDSQTCITSISILNNLR